MITRMFGRSWLTVGPPRTIGGALELLGGGSESLIVSATALIARPAPRTPPAARPPLTNVRRSTLLSCARSMLAIRALILGPAAAVGLALVAQAAPTCTPATLNNSALAGGSVTLSPLPGSRDAAPLTQISFRGAPAGALSAISVVGSRTGVHSGRLAPYSQGDGASFLPARPFAEGERVTVHARLRNGGSAVALIDRFVIARADAISTTPERVHPGVASQVQGFYSRPDLHP